MVLRLAGMLQRRRITASGNVILYSRHFLDGKDYRLSLGRLGEIPRELERKPKDGMTFGNAFKEFMERYSKPTKDSKELKEDNCVTTNAYFKLAVDSLYSDSLKYLKNFLTQIRRILANTFVEPKDWEIKNRAWRAAEESNLYLSLIKELIRRE